MKTTQLIKIIPLTVLLLLISSSISSAEMTGFNMEPSSIFIRSNNQSFINQTIKITNPTKLEQSIKIEKKDFSVDELGNISIKNTTSKKFNSTTRKVKVTENNEEIEKINLKSNETKYINISHKESTESQNDDNIFGLLLTSESKIQNKIEDKKTTAITALSTGILVPIFIVKEDQLNVSNDIIIDKLNTTSNPEIGFEIVNNSEHSVLINTKQEVQDVFGRSIETHEYNKKIILGTKNNSETKRVYKSNIQKNLITGIYKIKLTSNDENNNNELSKNRYIIILQVKETIILITTLLGIYIIIKRIKVIRDK